MAIPYTDNFAALNAVTATVAAADALPFDASKRQLKSIQFVASAVSSGNGVFTVEVTNSQTAAGVPNNWVVYNRLIPNLVGTNAQTDAHVAGPTLSSNTSQMFFFPTSDYFRYIRVSVARTTDGTYSAILQQGG